MVKNNFCSNARISIQDKISDALLQNDINTDTRDQRCCFCLSAIAVKLQRVFIEGFGNNKSPHVLTQ